MASEKENMQALKTIGAAFFAVGLVCAELLASGCGAPPEDGPEIGQAEEAISGSAKLPLLYGQYVQGPDVSEHGVLIQTGESAANGWCPDNILSSAVCSFPSSQTVTIRDLFNVTVGPETHVNFHTQLANAVAYLNDQLSIGAPWRFSVGGSTGGMSFGSNPAGTLAGTLQGNLFGCVHAPVGRGAGQVCSFNPSTSTTVFDEHQIALQMNSYNLSGSARDNYVYDTILHELGHRIAQGHKPSTIMNRTDFPEGPPPAITGLRYGFDVSQVHIARVFVP